MHEHCYFRSAVLMNGRASPTAKYTPSNGVLAIQGRRTSISPGSKRSCTVS
jgi:hypothetical protein